MNQFKRAKQKALESGHHVEDIGDLKTAGVKEPLKENIKETEEQTTIIYPEDAQGVIDFLYDGKTSSEQ